MAALSALEPLDLVKCWSFVHYLANLDRERLRKLTLLLKTGKRSANEAFPEVYELTAEEMDERWREFVRRTY